MIRSWKSNAFVKPPHGKYRKVRGKLDRTLHDIRKDKARCQQAIRHSRKSLRALPGILKIFAVFTSK
jgi:hypothetical protein